MKDEDLSQPDVHKYVPSKTVSTSECAHCDFKVKDHEISIHVNNLRDIAVKFASSQQLREHIRHEVYRFNKWEFYK